MTTAPLNAFAVPAPHRRIDGFMGEEMVARLLAHVAARQDAFVPTQVGHGTLNRNIRASLLLLDFGDLRDELETRMRGVVDWALEELRMSPLHLARIEMELVAHGDGAFYSPHIDTVIDLPDSTSDRALTGVYYFHRQPKRYSGGALRLLPIRAREDEETFTDIIPGDDTLVLFPSWAPHEVRPVSCPSGEFMDSRFAINYWCRHRRSSPPS